MATAQEDDRARGGGEEDAMVEAAQNAYEVHSEAMATPAQVLEEQHLGGAYMYADPYYSNLALAAYGPHAMAAAQHIALMGGGAAGLVGPRVPLPISQQQQHMEEEPVYVNAKQYHGILRRRESRAKAEAENRLLRSRKPYLHESRHQHAVRRARGCGGRFLNKDASKDGEKEDDEDEERQAPRQQQHEEGRGATGGTREGNGRNNSASKQQQGGAQQQQPQQQQQQQQQLQQQQQFQQRQQQEQYQHQLQQQHQQPLQAQLPPQQQAYLQQIQQQRQQQLLLQQQQLQQQQAAAMGLPVPTSAALIPSSLHLATSTIPASPHMQAQQQQQQHQHHQPQEQHQQQQPHAQYQYANNDLVLPTGANNNHPYPPTSEPAPSQASDLLQVLPQEAPPPAPSAFHSLPHHHQQQQQQEQQQFQLQLQQQHEHAEAQEIAEQNAEDEAEEEDEEGDGEGEGGDEEEQRAAAHDNSFEDPQQGHQQQQQEQQDASAKQEPIDPSSLPSSEGAPVDLGAPLSFTGAGMPHEGGASAGETDVAAADSWRKQ
eukprot:TRINITY_DN25_c2_g6_i1.p1 TRINITY_DN25_c2_g6~~TRINITY_DN25_c2_g6_i1.p1  ORF type:complete len:543 (-),score=256.46 TRINITY_DN25_c2_g6_i1:406-2034(-)